MDFSSMPDSDGSDEWEGWTRIAFGELLERLLALGHLAHVKVLMLTLEYGFISRVDVLRLAGRPPRGNLKGWIAPMAAVIEAMKRDQLLPRHASSPLVTRYDNNSAGLEYPPLVGYELPLPLRGVVCPAP